jgi:hypothetical protein
MSLGDYLRLLRAQRGGITPVEVEAAAGLAPGVYRYMEQRYRAVGTDAEIEALASFYGVPFEDLRWRLDWPRKALSRALVAGMQPGAPITLELWDGSRLTGRVLWWDLGAAELRLGDGRTVVIQRHAVEKWEPRAPEPELAAPVAD